MKCCNQNALCAEQTALDDSTTKMVWKKGSRKKEGFLSDLQTSANAQT